MLCGLLGKKLSHSYSPQIHQFLGDYSYELFERQPDEIPDFFKNGNFAGINVTIPYKKDVIPYCNELTDCAKALGAVNTIVRKPDGKLIGHNTDYFGFQYMVNQSGVSVTGKKALVLGSGGASVTAVAVLQNLGANVIVISRSGQNNYSNLHLHKDAAVIVNATPVGMYPHTDQAPELPYSALGGPHILFDLIYNPAVTKFLSLGAERGAVSIGGEQMFSSQAEASWEIWNSTDEF